MWSWRRDPRPHHLRLLHGPGGPGALVPSARPRKGDEALSNKLRDHVYGLELPPHLREVLLVLADHQNDDGRPAFPSVESISWKLGKHRSTVQRALSQLREAGLIRAVGGIQGGRGRATQYVLTPLNGRHKAPRAEHLFATEDYERAAFNGKRAARKRAAPVHTKGRTHAAPTPKNLELPPISSRTVTLDIGGFGGGSAFNEFYAAYPRKVQRRRAERAFTKALGRADAGAICEGARRLAADPNLPAQRFIPYPEKWLNADAWLDEPLAVLASRRDPRPRDIAGEHILQDFPGGGEWNGTTGRGEVGGPDRGGLVPDAGEQVRALRGEVSGP